MRLRFKVAIGILTTLSLSPVLADIATPQDIVAAYSLTVSTTLPFPTATLSPASADSFLISKWSLNKNHIQNNPANLAFVHDPFPSRNNSPSSASPVLQTTYPQGTFSDNNGGGGAQFFSLFNGSLPNPQTMLVSYEVAFDTGFDWVKGGKLPGLRGGPVVLGCEGGSFSNGSNCFSTRLMWRTNGTGEVYAYLPPSNNGLCSNSGAAICDADFGMSIGRSSFSFKAGTWNKISLLVQLNSPMNVANGNIMLYYNNTLAIQQSGLQLRNSEQVHVNGLFFSTFFGGDDPSWAPPEDQHSFYRNFQLWASSSPSNATGAKVSSATSLLTKETSHIPQLIIVVVLSIAFSTAVV